MFKMNLQVFALDDVEDDDPNGVDLDDDEDLDDDLDDDDSDVFDDDEAFKKLVGKDKASEDDDDDDEDDDEPGEPKPKEKEKAGIPEQQGQDKVFTQEEVNQIIGKARIKGREYEDLISSLQAETGMDLPSIVKHVKDAKENQLTQKYIEESYLDEDEARERAKKDIENENLKAKVQEYHKHQALTQKSMQYSNDKQKFLSNPLVKKYEQEIDNFSQGGQLADFEVAMKYVLGAKVYEGDMLKDLKTGTEKKTMANLDKRSKVKVESGSQTGEKVGAVSKEVRNLAKLMGISEKEVARQQKIIEKEKGRRR